MYKHVQACTSTYKPELPVDNEKIYGYAGVSGVAFLQRWGAALQGSRGKVGKS
jgi:hypothetical protein